MRHCLRFSIRHWRCSKRTRKCLKNEEKNNVHKGKWAPMRLVGSISPGKDRQVSDWRQIFFEPFCLKDGKQCCRVSLIWEPLTNWKRVLRTWEPSWAHHSKNISMTKMKHKFFNWYISNQMTRTVTGRKLRLESADVEKYWQTGCHLRARKRDNLRERGK